MSESIDTDRTCYVHRVPLVHEPGGDDMPTIHGRTYCPKCNERLMRALDATQ